MKSISMHQFCAIIFILLIGNKLLVLPSMLYETGKNDALLFIIFALIIDFLCIMLFVYANNKSKNSFFFERSEQVFGKFISKVLAVAFIAYFLLKSFLTLKETEKFLSTTIYTSLDGVMFIIPIILVVLYVVAKGIQNVGRITEVFSGIVFFGILLSLLIAIPNINLDGILPFGVASAGEYLDMLSKSAMWFGNYFVLYFLIGRVEIDKKSYKKVSLTVIIASLLVVALFWCFYSIFETSSVIYHFAISDITSFAPALSSLAKIDWFTVLFYGFTMVLQLILHFYIVIRLAEHTLERKFGFKFYIGFALILILAYLLIPYGFNTVLEFCAATLSTPASILNLFTPFAIIVMYMIVKKKPTDFEKEGEDTVQRNVKKMRGIGKRKRGEDKAESKKMNGKNLGSIKSIKINKGASNISVKSLEEK